MRSRGGSWFYQFRLSLYADMSAAVHADMAIHVAGVDDVAILPSRWTQKRTSWIVKDGF